MPPRQKKTTATPAEAAAKEALSDGDVELEFRGEKFVVREQSRRSARFVMAYASGNEPQMIFESISPEDRPRFLNLAQPGEDYADFAIEFFEALAEASGQGNS